MGWLTPLLAFALLFAVLPMEPAEAIPSACRDQYGFRVDNRVEPRTSEYYCRDTTITINTTRWVFVHSLGGNKVKPSTSLVWRRSTIVFVNDDTVLKVRRACGRWMWLESRRGFKVRCLSQAQPTRSS